MCTVYDPMCFDISEAMKIKTKTMPVNKQAAPLMHSILVIRMCTTWISGIIIIILL